MRHLSGRVDWLFRRLAPRIGQWHASQQRKSGLSPHTSREQQLAMLRRYYSHLRHLELGREEPVHFTVVVLDAGTGSAELRESLGSVLIQAHPDWRVTVAGASDTESSRVAARFAEFWPDRWQTNATSENAELAETLNTLAAMCDDYLVVLDSRDRLLPHSLGEFARAIRLVERDGGDRPAVLYGDEINRSAALVDPVLKPGWSPLLQLMTNYADGPVAMRADHLLDIGGFSGSSRSEIMHDFLLRSGTSALPVHVPHPLLLRRSPIESPLVQAVAEVCERAGIAVDVKKDAGRVAVDFKLSDPVPRVSVVIPNRDSPDLISACINSLGRSTYPNYEIVIVDNGSRDPRTWRLYEDWSAEGRLTIVDSPGHFNYARLNNVGVAATGGEFVLLLNNDTEVLTPDWLEQMVGVARFPNVGIVGAQLRYPNGTIQHAGIIGLAEHGTGHQFVARDPQSRAPLDLLNNPHEVLAVTGACLLTTRALYNQLDGLDEDFLPNDSGDIDFCLRARSFGRTCAYQPRAVLRHHESPSRKRSFENLERFALLRRWPDELLNDPYLNPNLTKGTKYQVNPDFPIPMVPLDLLRAWCRSGRIEWL